MAANDIQVAGSHYKTQYQHWDWVTDCGLSYLQGCASKYVWRWRTKGGTEDLRKAVHFLEKAIERGVSATQPTKIVDRFTDLFVNDMPKEMAPEKYIMIDIAQGDYVTAINDIESLIENYELTGYVNQG